MNILFITHHWYNNSHHSKYSGFQRLVNFTAKKHNVTVVTWGEKNENFIDENGINVIIIKPFIKNSFIIRFIISLHARKIQESYDVVHALYSDCTYFLKKNSFIVTIHILPSIAKHKNIKSLVFLYLKYFLFQKRCFKYAKKVVCVSNNLLQTIAKKRKDVIYIPHGIDTNFWKIEKDELELKNIKMVLCVGSHGVNYAQLCKIININTNYEFHIIGMKDYPYYHKNCKKYSRISDYELKQLYKEAFFMLRPIYFATANNSILEAMSMGCIVITNKVPGILNYLNDQSCIFIEEMNNYQIQDNKYNYIELRNNALAKINNVFSWDNIVEEYEKVYKLN